MNNDSQGPSPPSYSKLSYFINDYQWSFFCFLADVIDKSVPPPAGSRAAMYTAPPPPPSQEQQSEMKYTSPNPPLPTAYGIQVAPMPTFGRIPVQCTCPHCRSPIITRVEESTGVLAWIVCIILLFFGCWLGCCLIPFCISDLQNIRHHCPNCNAFIGEYRPL